MTNIPDAILSLITQAAKVTRAGGNTRPHFEKLLEELSAHEHLPFDKDAIQNLLKRDKLAGQILVRHLREINAFQFDEVSNLERLYFALPIVIPGSTDFAAETLQKVSAILADWISSEGLIEGSALIADAPSLSLNELHFETPSLDDFSVTALDSQLKQEKGEIVAGVWSGANI